jgi:hypothetical protein
MFQLPEIFSSCEKIFTDLWHLWNILKVNSKSQSKLRFERKTSATFLPPDQLMPIYRLCNRGGNKQVSESLKNTDVQGSPSSGDSN